MDVNQIIQGDALEVLSKLPDASIQCCVTCKQCGKEIKRRGTKKPVFCSYDCKGEWQRAQNPLTKEWLQQKYGVEGLSTYDIAAIVHRDPKRIYEKLVEFGIPTRPRGLNLKGEDHHRRQPNYKPSFEGKHHSDGTRTALSKIASREKPWLRGTQNGMSGRTGASNPHYIDGSSPERQRLYASAEWKEIQRTIYARDNYHCQRCGSPHKGYKRLHAHHIKSWAGNPSLRFDLNNIITLCRSCHEWVHSKKNVNHDFIKEEGGK